MCGRRRKPPAGPYTGDASTLSLLHMEQLGQVVSRAAGDGYVATPPRVFDSNGTLYAVYDLLERYCNVRWYLPGANWGRSRRGRRP